MSQKIMSLRSDWTAFSPGQDEIGHVYDKKIDLSTFCDDFKPYKNRKYFIYLWSVVDTKLSEGCLGCRRT